MKDKFQCNLTRRRFNAGLVMAGIGIVLAGYYGFKRNNRESADGLLSLAENGKIYIHSGGGHLGLYAWENATRTVKEILRSGTDHFVVNYGNNPAQLPNLLAQHSNHLSFSSASTNIRAAKLLKDELKREASTLLGGRAEDYMIENGYVLNGARKISFAQLASGCRRQVIEPGICEKTYKLINKLEESGIIVAVGQVV